MGILKAYSWPGNIRELKNVLIRAILESRGSILLADAVESVLTDSEAGVVDSKDALSMGEVERNHIRQAMSESGGNLSAAARSLGISRPTLRKRLRYYGLYQSCD